MRIRRIASMPSSLGEAYAILKGRLTGSREGAKKLINKTKYPRLRAKVESRSRVERTK